MALLYKEEVEKRMIATWLIPKYKYYHYGSYCDEVRIEESTWNKIQMASVHNGEVIGYLSISIGRDCNKASGLEIIRFNDNNECTLEWTADLYKFVTDLFKVYQFRKLSFSVVVGNPAEDHYDRIIAKLHARVVGIEKEHIKLWDGKLYDVKNYEVLRAETKYVNETI